ncbi:MAG: hypothetical protein PHF72_12925 [Gammaproteobacteria bacterium]|nr:hypothetical protein [Gammaproteobacteria bacterium]
MITTKASIQRLLRVHMQHGVPLEMSVPFLLKLAGWGVAETANAAGFTRTHLYFALRGDRTAPEPLRRLLRERLGADPWSVRAQEPMENRGGHTVATPEGGDS